VKPYGPDLILKKNVHQPAFVDVSEAEQVVYRYVVHWLSLRQDLNYCDLMCLVRRTVVSQEQLHLMKVLSAPWASVI